MKDSVIIFGKEFEYDFLSGWIKYNRLQHQYSQDALAYGICSTSLLSYFESGKKKLNGEAIELLLKKLGIHSIKDFKNIGQIRQKMYVMMFQIESMNFESARQIFSELKETEDLISLSPYNIEYKIYQLLYNSFVEGLDYASQKQDIENIDRIYSSLTEELKYLFMFISGKLIYKYINHNDGINRLEMAQKIKDTPWINYHLGFSYCFNLEYLRGTYYLEKALESYERDGRYINAVWCHNYLGICYNHLKIYDKAEKHYMAALTGAEHFSIDKIFEHVYTNLADFYLCTGDYSESMKWSKEALKVTDDPVLPVYNLIEASMKSGRLEECRELFDHYLDKQYEKSRYYKLLYFLYLSTFHLNEDLFYHEVTGNILPFYEDINYISTCRPIKLKLIEHLENKRKYKQAIKIYKELIEE